jgi:tetratricopeptide (TPR) repeat protein
MCAQIATTLPSTPPLGRLAMFGLTRSRLTARAPCPRTLDQVSYLVRVLSVTPPSDLPARDRVEAAASLLRRGAAHYNASRWHEARAAFQAALVHLAPLREGGNGGGGSPGEGAPLPELLARGRRMAVRGLANLAAVLQRLGDHAKALDACEQVRLSRSPSALALHSQLASVFRGTERQQRSDS